MPRLIDADKLLDILDVMIIGHKSASDVYDVVDSMPTVDAEPIRHGHWIDRTYKYRYPVGRYECSVCGAAHDMEWGYCPHCGAKMDEVST